MTCGTPGIGTSLHITMAQVAGMPGIEWTHLPFRGWAENAQALFDPAHIGPGDDNAFARRTHEEEGAMIRRRGLRP